jgi:hypothetical protein
MYGYITTALIVFLTHPGVIQSFFDPGIFGGIFQAILVLMLQSPSEGRKSASLTIEIIYWILFAVWVYIKARMAMMGGVTGMLTR